MHIELYLAALIYSIPLETESMCKCDMWKKQKTKKQIHRQKVQWIFGRIFFFCVCLCKISHAFELNMDDVTETGQHFWFRYACQAPLCIVHFDTPIVSKLQIVIVLPIITIIKAANLCVTCSYIFFSHSYSLCKCISSRSVDALVLQPYKKYGVE